MTFDFKKNKVNAKRLIMFEDIPQGKTVEQEDLCYIYI